MKPNTPFAFLKNNLLPPAGAALEQYYLPILETETVAVYRYLLHVLYYNASDVNSQLITRLRFTITPKEMPQSISPLTEGSKPLLLSAAGPENCSTKKFVHTSLPAKDALQHKVYRK